jgi:hypothetical protein
MEKVILFLKCILKSILFYVTVLVSCFTLVGIDSIIAKGYLTNMLLLVVSLIGLCILFLTKEDIKEITIYKDINSNIE